MKDTNNKITEEEFTKGESVRVEMPVEKTVEKLRKNIALHFYNANYPQAYTQEEIYKYEKEVDYFMALIQEVKSQVRREVVEEIKKIASFAECESPDEGESSRCYFYHIGREEFTKFLEEIKN